MEELIEAMRQEMDLWILKDKESGEVFDLIQVSDTIKIMEKYIAKAWNHDNI